MTRTPDSSSTASEPPLPDLAGSLELLQRFQDGDAHALQRLLERYRPRLLRIVRIRMGVRLERFEGPEDIVQDTLIVAARKLGELQPRDHSSILRWLAQVAQNQIRDRLDYYGAQRRAPPGGGSPHRLRGAGGGSSSGVDVSADGPSPSDEVRRKEAQALVDDAVARLEPEAFRQVILERDYLGADWEQVRAALGRSTVEAAQELHRRARIKLRTLLRPHLDDHDPGAR
jgi:RNA polymerase sigma-70 factor (ECF subfamily)